MLREPKNDLIHLLGILESSAKVFEYANGYSSADEFLSANHEMNYNACLTLLTVVGESIGKLSDAASTALSDLPLRRIRGLRNRKDFLMSQIQANVFDPEEIRIARESKFYTRVKF